MQLMHFPNDAIATTGKITNLQQTTDSKHQTASNCKIK